jgi:hypothetical protein
MQLIYLEIYERKVKVKVIIMYAFFMLPTHTKHSNNVTFLTSLNFDEIHTSSTLITLRTSIPSRAEFYIPLYLLSILYNHLNIRGHINARAFTYAEKTRTMF